MNFHILAKKNFGPGIAFSKFTTVRLLTHPCANQSMIDKLMDMDVRWFLLQHDSLGCSAPELRYDMTGPSY